MQYPSDAETWQAWSAEQNVPLNVAPPLSAPVMSIAVMPTVDHDVIRTGIYCSAWNITNPMRQLVQEAFALPDKSTVGNGLADVMLTVKSANTVSRCVSTGEMKATCITRVALTGSVARAGTGIVPVSASVETATRAVGVCAGLTRGIAVVSRNALSAFVAKVNETLQK